MNSVNEFLRGFKEENHVLWLVRFKGKELMGGLEGGSAMTDDRCWMKKTEDGRWKGVCWMTDARWRMRGPVIQRNEESHFMKTKDRRPETEGGKRADRCWMLDEKDGRREMEGGVLDVRCSIADAWTRHSEERGVSLFGMKKTEDRRRKTGDGKWEVGSREVGGLKVG